MNALSISPSAAALLEKVAEGSSATLAELASNLRLSPTEIRSDIVELQQKGWAALDDDSVVVHVTPEGKNANHLIVKHPEIFEKPVAAMDYQDPEIFEQPVAAMDEKDLDAAIDVALERNRAGHSENAAAAHPMDNLRDADATAQ
jgi:DNA-binding Lrp family transcriptional regulator